MERIRRNIEIDFPEDMEYFYLDGHCHFSPENAYKVIEKAINKGLNALAITEFNSKDIKPRDRFQRIIKNKNNSVFPKNFTSYQTNDYSATIIKEEKCKTNFGSTTMLNRILLFNSQEIDTLDGHVLALFTNRYFEPGLPLKETIYMLTENNVPFVIPHPYAKFFRGVGEGNILEIYDDFPYTKFALEDNGQISWVFRKWNEKAHDLAKKLDLAMVGFSDGHLEYPLQSRTVGNLCSAMPNKYIHRGNLKKSFTEVITNHKDEIKICGKHRSTPGVLFWMACSKIKKK